MSLGRIISPRGERGNQQASQANPWLRPGDPAGSAPILQTATAAPTREVALLVPQPRSVRLDPGARRLPRRLVEPAASLLHIVGAHGGAGESTVAVFLNSAQAGGHAWPVHEAPGLKPERVLLVCRSDAPGLWAAQGAAMEWASGSVPVELLGLVAVADAPGRRPKPLQQLLDHVAAAVPRLFEIPWLEALRLGERPEDLARSSRELHNTLEALRALCTPTQREGA